MKAKIFTTTVLMIVALAANAQNSRSRERTKETSTQPQERKTNEVKPENKKVNERSYQRTNPPAARKQENTQTNQQQADQSRRGNTNTTERRQVESNRTENKRVVTGNSDNRRDQDHRNDSRQVVQHGNNGNHNDHVYQSSRGNHQYVRIDRSPRRVVVVNHPQHYSPRPVDYRRTHYPYRVPLHHEIFWSVNLFHDFRIFYPEVRYWRYETGYRLPSIPAYDAYDYIGEVARVYGRVFEVFYDQGTDDYFLYFGDYYPYHDFSITVPGMEARRISRRPERFFQQAEIAITGYITEFDNKPEIVVRRASQIDIY